MNINSKERKKNCINSCTQCDKVNCPYLYCGHIDCLLCKNRVECPMCNGECKKCTDFNLCNLKHVI